MITSVTTRANSSTNGTASPFSIKPEPADTGYETTTTSSTSTSRTPFVIAPTTPTTYAASTSSFSVPAPVMLLPQMSGLSGLSSGNVVLVPSASLQSLTRTSGGSLLSSSILQGARRVSRPISVTQAARTINIGGTTAQVLSGATAPGVSISSGSPAMTINLGGINQRHTSGSTAAPAAQPVNQPRTVCGLIYNTKVPVSTGKGSVPLIQKKREFLCNFCQFKTAMYNAFNTHLAYHIFNCHHCSFKTFTRFELINHRQTKHPEFNYELSGFEGLPNVTPETTASTTVTISVNSTVSTPRVTTSQPIVSTPPVPTAVSSASPDDSLPAVAPTPITIAPDSPEPPPPPPTDSMDTSQADTPQADKADEDQANTTGNGADVDGDTVTTADTDDVAEESTTPLPAVTPLTIEPDSLFSIPGASDLQPGETRLLSKQNFNISVKKLADGKIEQTFSCNGENCTFSTQTIAMINNHLKMNPSCILVQSTQATDLDKSAPSSAKEATQSSSSTASKGPISTWECFYCAFPSAEQSDVVKHLHKEHPGQELKVKRIVRQNPSDKSCNEADGETTWGCYYCFYQAAERSNVIVHVRKNHPQKKIMITRQRKIPAEKPTKSSDKSKEGKDIQGSDNDSDFDPNKERAKLNMKNYKLEDVKILEKTDEHTTISVNLENTDVCIQYMNQSDVPEPDPAKLIKVEGDCTTCTACGKSLKGPHGIVHIKNHIRIKHSEPGSERWACGYCAVKNHRRDLIVKHVIHYHKGQQAKVICKKPFKVSSDGVISSLRRVINHKSKADCDESVQPRKRSQRKRKSRGIKYAELDSDEEQDEDNVSTYSAATTINKASMRLRGPRCKRDAKMIDYADFMYKCPHCVRFSVSRSEIIKHIVFVHPKETVPNPEDVVKISRPVQKVSEIMSKESERLRRCSVYLVSVEAMERYPVLEEVLRTDGDSLTHHLDINDESASEEDTASIASMDTARRRRSTTPRGAKRKRQREASIECDPDAEETPEQKERREQAEYESRASRARKLEKTAKKRGLEPVFQCKHCDLLAHQDLVMKEHLRENHAELEFAAINKRQKQGSKHSITYFCYNQRCEYSTKVRDAIFAHYSKNETHCPPNMKQQQVDTASNEEEIPKGTRSLRQRSSIGKSKGVEFCMEDNLPKRGKRKSLKPKIEDSQQENVRDEAFVNESEAVLKGDTNKSEERRSKPTIDSDSATEVEDNVTDDAKKTVSEQPLKEMEKKKYDQSNGDSEEKKKENESRQSKQISKVQSELVDSMDTSSECCDEVSLLTDCDSEKEATSKRKPRKPPVRSSRRCKVNPEAEAKRNDQQIPEGVFVTDTEKEKRAVEQLEKSKEESSDSAQIGDVLLTKEGNVNSPCPSNTEEAADESMEIDRDYRDDTGASKQSVIDEKYDESIPHLSPIRAQPSAKSKHGKKHKFDIAKDLPQLENESEKSSSEIIPVLEPEIKEKDNSNEDPLAKTDKAHNSKAMELTNDSTSSPIEVNPSNNVKPNRRQNAITVSKEKYADDVVTESPESAINNELSNDDAQTPEAKTTKNKKSDSVMNNAKPTPDEDNLNATSNKDPKLAVHNDDVEVPPAIDQQQPISGENESDNAPVLEEPSSINDEGSFSIPELTPQKQSTSIRKRRATAPITSTPSQSDSPQPTQSKRKKTNVCKPVDSSTVLAVQAQAKSEATASQLEQSNDSSLTTFNDSQSSPRKSRRKKILASNCDMPILSPMTDSVADTSMSMGSDMDESTCDTPRGRAPRAAKAKVEYFPQHTTTAIGAAFSWQRQMNTDPQVVLYKQCFGGGANPPGEDKEAVLTRLRGLLICRYCAMPSTTSLPQMKAHLSAQHPHLDPVAIDVKNKLQKKSSTLYICPMANCHFHTPLLKLFISHLKEHPDTQGRVTLSQTAISVKKAAAKGKNADDMEALESLPPHLTAAMTRDKPKKKASNTRKGAKKVDNTPSVPNLVSLPNIDDVYNLTGAMRSKARSKKIHSKDRFICKYCSAKDFTFSNLTKGKAHLLHMHKNQTFVVIDQHAQKVRKKSKIYLCCHAECSFLCKTKDELAAHICGSSGSGTLNDLSAGPSNSQEEESMFQCSFCTFATAMKANVIQHLEKSHPGEAKDGFTEVGGKYEENGQFVMSARQKNRIEGKDDLDKPVQNATVEARSGLKITLKINRNSVESPAVGSSGDSELNTSHESESKEEGPSAGQSSESESDSSSESDNESSDSEGEQVEETTKAKGQQVKENIQSKATKKDANAKAGEVDVKKNETKPESSNMETKMVCTTNDNDTQETTSDKDVTEKAHSDMQTTNVELDLASNEAESNKKPEKVEMREISETIKSSKDAGKADSSVEMEKPESSNEVKDKAVNDDTKCKASKDCNAKDSNSDTSGSNSESASSGESGSESDSDGSEAKSKAVN